MSQQIQQEITNLFDQTVSGSNEQLEENDPEVKSELVDDIIYETIEDTKDSELLLAEEAIQTVTDPVEIDYVEVDLIDNTKLPKEFQSPDDRQKIIKSKSIKAEGDDSLIVIQLDNNTKLFQCEICQRTFKEKSKLKSHRQIHTTERNIVCEVSKIMFQKCLFNTYLI